MKNIHLIPTDKPSRLGYLTKKGKQVFNDLRLFNRVMPNILDSENQHLYITNSEEIKYGDWFITTDTNEIEKSDWVKLYFPNVRKIILTDNLDLIKDGVQAIPDEFLKWLVKNPNCEEVEVEKVLVTNSGLGYQEYAILDSNFKVIEINTKIPQRSYRLGKVTILDSYEYVVNYKIIIPKEEPKQIKCYDKFNQLLSEGDYVDVQKDGVQLIYKKEDNQLYFKPYGEEDRVSAYLSNDLAKCDEVGNWVNNDRYEDIVEEPKQETLEEAAEKFRSNNPGTMQGGNNTKILNAFRAGAKWQQERMYSEAELYIKLHNLMTDIKLNGLIINDDMDLKKWVNQNKKKQNDSQ